MKITLIVIITITITTTWQQTADVLFCDNRGERATIRLTGETAHRSAEHRNGIRKPAAKTQSVTTSLNLKTCSNRTIHTQCDLRPMRAQDEQSLAIQPRTSLFLRPLFSHHLPHVDENTCRRSGSTIENTEPTTQANMAFKPMSLPSSWVGSDAHVKNSTTSFAICVRDQVPLPCPPPPPPPSS